MAFIDHCLNCQSKHINFVDDVEIPFRGKCKQYFCTMCGVYFIVDSEGNLVRQY
jgi:hypothetical protein